MASSVPPVLTTSSTSTTLRPIYRLCARYAPSAAEAEELCQEVYFKLWENLHRYKTGSNFMAWAWRVAKNLIIDSYRRSRREREAAWLDPEIIERLRPEVREGTYGGLFNADLKPIDMRVVGELPLSMLGAFALMRAFGITGNLLSLGAIDFGLVVDGAVVVVEGALATMAVHRLNGRQASCRVASEVGQVTDSTNSASGSGRMDRPRRPSGRAEGRRPAPSCKLS